MRRLRKTEPVTHQELSLDEVIMVRDFKSKMMVIISVLAGGVGVAWLAVSILRSSSGFLMHF